MKPRGCWYCDGTVNFDSDGNGYCDSCPETYSAREFIERENEARRKVQEAASEERRKRLEVMLEYANTCLGIENTSDTDF